jgi:hypothetical protein
VGKGAVNVAPGERARTSVGQVEVDVEYPLWWIANQERVVASTPVHEEEGQEAMWIRMGPE